MNEQSPEIPSPPPAIPASNSDATDPQNSVLGVPTDKLAGLSVEEICGNKVAVTMVMHYYKQLVDQNITIRNQLNTANSYVDAYKTKRMFTTIAAILFLIANIGIGFGVNLLTAGSISPGWATLIPAICFAIAAIVFTVRGGS
ncbi:MAG: hypothetical protein U0573_08960 [Phycisphaerales bacterium]|nr:hypothetical protein [Planctomycetota bacterium]